MKITLRPFLVAAATFGIGVLTATSAVAQTRGQASLTLTNNDATYCFKHQNNWSLSKTDDFAGGTSGHVTWTVTAVKTDGGTSFTVLGGLTITNTGSGLAPIGNIVINLQRKNSHKINGKLTPWVSVAADVADATNGDNATVANIASAGSQEDPATNSLYGIGNYVVSGSKGTFTESAGSGKLEFTDANSNSIFSLVPQLYLPAGASITLLYRAEFDPTVIAAAGNDFRVEALVTFGRAGLRGGSGASAPSIDINGNGTVDKDENWVRTVPARTSMGLVLSTPEECNDSATIGDLGLDSEGDATFSNVTGLDQFPATVNASQVWTIEADVDGGVDGGFVCNEATLDSAGDSKTLNIVVGHDPLGNPIYLTVPCCFDVHLTAQDCVPVDGDGGPPTGFPDGSYFTFTQGKYNDHANNAVANYVEAHFASLFVGGKLTIGVIGATTHDASWTDVDAFRLWIGGGGPSGALTADTLNATSTSGGTLAKQTGALTLTLALQGAVIPGVNGGNPLPSGLGSLKLKDTGTSLDGQTVSQILAAANQALGAGTLPPGYTFSSLNDLIDNLNKAFDDGITSSWANAHLTT
ncbi:MAG: hypothetical protein JSS65_06605 [Armatimonadetes bacterium]|nr:hypothetical protein [Armatimonadota bacterium]